MKTSDFYLNLGAFIKTVFSEKLGGGLLITERVINTENTVHFDSFVENTLSVICSIVFVGIDYILLSFCVLILTSI